MNHCGEEPGQLKVAQVARGARAAARVLATLSSARRNEILLAAAAAIEDQKALVLEANQRDCQAAMAAVEDGGMSRAVFARLQTSERGIAEMAGRVRDVAALPDPLGRRLSATELDEDLVLYKESCPLGVIGIIFESRPDVVPQVSALALKSGNAVLLKGGTEAAQTNQALVSIWRDTLANFPEVPAEAINLLHLREDVRAILDLDNEIDLIIPRGSRDFVRYISAHSHIPVLGHGEGICHVYVDAAADLNKARKIVMDSKVQYPAACNAAETLLVHEAAASEFLPPMLAQLKEAGVEVRGCSRTLALVPLLDLVPATEADWRTEYSDLIISVRVVRNIDEAIDHINTYGSKHTETIVTRQREVAARFMEEVDAAGVYHNASTRFADGFRYGLGAELGISTSKLHARGPVGLEGLTTYKYKLFGNGHVVASYSNGERTFKHRSLK